MKRFLAFLVTFLMFMFLPVAIIQAESHLEYSGHPIQQEFQTTHYRKDSGEISFLNVEKNTWKKMDNVDVETFQVISGIFSRDKDTIYAGGESISASPSEFIVISGAHGYGADDNHVYGPSGKILGADVDSFKMLNKDYSQDKNFVYFQGVKTSMDPDHSESILNKDSDQLISEVIVHQIQEVLPVENSPVGTSYESSNSPKEDDSVEKDAPESKANILTSKNNTDTGEVVHTFETEVTQSNQTEAGNNIEPFGAGTRAIVSWLYRLLLGVAFFGTLIALYVFFNNRNNLTLTLQKGGAQIIISSIIAGVIMWLASFLLSMDMATWLLVFYFLLGTILAFMISNLFKGGMKKFIIIILTLILHALVVFFLYYIFSNINSGTSEIFEKPQLLINGLLIILPLVLITMMYRSSISEGYIVSFIRTFIAVVIAMILILIMQNLLNISSIFWNITWFHIFAGLILFILGVRTEASAIRYSAKVLKMMLIHFIIVLLVVYLAAWIISL